MTLKNKRKKERSLRGKTFESPKNLNFFPLFPLFPLIFLVHIEAVVQQKWQTTHFNIIVTHKLRSIEGKFISVAPLDPYEPKKI